METLTERQALSFAQEHLEILPAIMEALDFPTDTAMAAALWRISGNGCMPCSEAAKLVRACGYIPYCGFPLSRRGKIRTQPREVCDSLLELLYN